MEEALRKLLREAPAMAALEGRVDWGVRPQGTALPAMTLRTISDIPEMKMSGPTGWSRARIQSDIYGSTFKAARDLRHDLVLTVAGLRATLGGIKFRIFVIDADSGVETVAKGFEHRARADLDIWYRP